MIIERQLCAQFRSFGDISRLPGSGYLCACNVDQIPVEAPLAGFKLADVESGLPMWQESVARASVLRLIIAIDRNFSEN